MDMLDVDTHMHGHTQADAGNDNIRRPKLATTAKKDNIWSSQWWKFHWNDICSLVEEK